MTGLCMVLVAAAAAAWLAAGAHGHGLGWMLEQRQAWRAWTSEHILPAMLGFVGLYVVAAVAAMPNAAVFSLMGGFLFGRSLGTALVLLGATANAAIVFEVARSAMGGPLRRRAGPLHDKVAAATRGHAGPVVLALRLVPVFPFFLVTLAAALFDIRLATFLLATAVGVAPAAFLYSSIGRDLGAVSSLSGLLTPGALAALTGLAGLALLPVVIRIGLSWRRRRTMGGG